MRFRLPMQGHGFNPRSGKIPRPGAIRCLVHQLLIPHSRAWKSQLLSQCLAATKAHRSRARAPKQEKASHEASPCTTMKRSPCSLRLKKAWVKIQHSKKLINTYIHTLLKNQSWSIIYMVFSNPKNMYFTLPLSTQAKLFSSTRRWNHSVQNKSPSQTIFRRKHAQRYFFKE